MRIVQLLVGVALAGGGGYLTWLNRALAPQLFPPDPHHEPWLLVGGLIGIVAGVVLLVGGLLPQPNRKAELAAAAERRQAAITAADAYYAERARAADRDWRSGPLPPEPAASPAASPFDNSPFGPSPFDPAPTSVAAPAAARAAASFATSNFPSGSTLTPIPRSTDGPLPTLPLSTPGPAPGPSPGPSLVFDADVLTANDAAAAPDAAPNAGPFDAIRAVLASGQLDEADRLLAQERNRLTSGGADTEIDLAELTGLAGDHAAASGRVGSAKWLWRLALQRFGAANAMTSPAARAVSERLRLADQ